MCTWVGSCPRTSTPVFVVGAGVGVMGRASIRGETLTWFTALRSRRMFGLAAERHCASAPPSMTISLPVMYDDSSDAR
jgi:hypothetical protein